MYREVYEELTRWQHRTERVPLLLRGARQVGKTTVVEQFGSTQFERFHEINFEFEPAYTQCFSSLDPRVIIESIMGLSGDVIEPGKSLLFFDEIQNCPRAIMALRYFKEKMPELHVIAAGSLLEFVLQEEGLSMPVGRIEYLYLQPLSFREYLRVLGFDTLLEHIQNATLEAPLSDVFHKKLLKLVREYLFVGGMPAAVKTYRDEQQFQSARRQQTIILSTYRDDFGKYAKKSAHKYLQKVFDNTPALLGQQIKYTRFDTEMRSRDLKEAITNLCHAGVIHSVFLSAASGLPLSALINEKKFKLLYLDIGLASRALRLTFNDLMKEELTLINKGALAEQFVGQELLAYTEAFEKATLHYWSRDKAGSEAEIDYVISLNSVIIPIEVKAGATGHLKSLHAFLQEKQSPTGLRISEHPLMMNDSILSIPFYMLSEIPRLVNAL